MRKVFVDTSGIIAFENVRDIDHTEAVRTLRVLQTSQPVRLVTSFNVTVVDYAESQSGSRDVAMLRLYTHSIR